MMLGKIGIEAFMASRQTRVYGGACVAKRSSSSAPSLSPTPVSSCDMFGAYHWTDIEQLGHGCFRRVSEHS